MSSLPLLLEAERRGILPPNKAALLKEARKRGIVPWEGAIEDNSRFIGGSHVPLAPDDPARVETPDRPNPPSKEYRTLVEPWIPDGRRNADEKTYLAKRSIVDKAGEAVAAAGSFPIRLLTKGQYGLGDAIKGVGLDSLGDTWNAAEQDFGLAYKPQLRSLSAAGEVALGGTGASAPRPSFSMPVPARAPVSRLTPAPQPITPRQAVRAEEAGHRLDDVQAFKDADIEPFGPALYDKGLARTARTIEELPVLGLPVKRAKAAVERRFAERRDELTRELGAPRSDEGLGNVVQGGLDRFRSASLDELDPGTVRSAGIDPFAGQGRNVRVGQKARNAAALAQNIAPQAGATGVRTSRGAARPVPGYTSQIGATRTRINDVSDTDLDRLIALPAQETSFATRAEALYEKARRGLPRLFAPDENGRLVEAPRTVNPSNTRAAIIAMRQGESAARVNSGVNSGRFGPALRDLVNIKPDEPITLDSLMAIRSEIGKVLGRFDDYDTGLDRQQLNRLYGSLSDDIEVGLREIANRAIANTSQVLDPRQRYYGSAQAGTVAPETAQRALQAVRDFQVASRYYRAGHEGMERFMRALNARTPDEAARMLGRALREQTSDMGLIRSTLNVLRPEEQRAVVGHVVGNWGRSRVGHSDYEQSFNFVNWIVEADKVMRNPEAAQTLLRPLSSEQRWALDAMLKVARRMEHYERRRNYVGASFGLGGASVAGLAFSFNTVNGLMVGVAAAGGAPALGWFLTSPRYASWLERHYRKIQASPQRSRTLLASSLRELRQIAKGDPEYGEVILRVIGAERQDAAPLALPPPSSAAESEPRQFASKQWREPMRLGGPKQFGLFKTNATTNILYGGAKAKNPPAQEEWFDGPVPGQSARRFEIDDSGAKAADLYKASPDGVLGDILDHPELYRNYPDMKDMPYKFEDLDQGVYGSVNMNHGEPFMTLDPNQMWEDDVNQEGLRGVLLHETQHGIQGVERWDDKEGGGGYDYHDRPLEWEAFAAQARQRFTPTMRKAEPGYHSQSYKLEGVPGRLTMDLGGFLETYDPGSLTDAEWGALSKIAAKAVDVKMQQSLFLDFLKEHEKKKGPVGTGAAKIRAYLEGQAWMDE